jgi:hypothetical protein
MNPNEPRVPAGQPGGGEWSGDADAADYQKWKSGLSEMDQGRRAMYGTSDRAPKMGEQVTRRHEVPLPYGSSGQQTLAPVSELVKPDGTPTQKFWNAWNDPVHRSAKSNLISSGLSPEKTPTGWTVKLGKSK